MKKVFCNAPTPFFLQRKTDRRTAAASSVRSEIFAPDGTSMALKLLLGSINLWCDSIGRGNIATNCIHMKHAFAFGFALFIALLSTSVAGDYITVNMLNRVVALRN